MDVVNNGHEHFAGAMDAEGFLDQQAFGVMAAALELDLEGFTEDAQGVVIGVNGAIDHRGDQALGAVVQEGVFENAFAGAGFAEDDAEPALLGVDSKDVKDFLLVGQERDGFGIKRVAVQAKVRADHRIEDLRICDWGSSPADRVTEAGGIVSARPELCFADAGHRQPRPANGLRPCVRLCNKRRSVVLLRSACVAAKTARRRDFAGSMWPGALRRRVSRSPQPRWLAHNSKGANSLGLSPRRRRVVARPSGSRTD